MMDQQRSCVYANMTELVHAQAPQSQEMVINPYNLMRARSSHSVVPNVTGKQSATSGWNFISVDRNVLGNTTSLNRGGVGNGPSNVVSNIMPGTLMSGPNNHVLTPVPGDPSGRLVMTLLPQGHEDPIASHSSHSNHSTQYATAGHNSSHSRQTLTSLRPSWFRGDVRSGSGSDGRGKGCATPTCSWRLLAIALLLTCGLLAAALAYLTVSTIGGSTSDPNCILVEDAHVTSSEDRPSLKDSVPPRTASSSSPSISGDSNDGGRSSRQEQSSLATHSVDAHNGDNKGLNSEATSAGPVGSSSGSGPGGSSSGFLTPRSGSLAAAELEANGQWHVLNIEAASLWVAYARIASNSALRILLQTPRGSPFAVYGRRNVAPSITQHDFAQFIHSEGQKLHSGPVDTRFRRQILNMTRSNFNTSLIKPVEPGRWFIALYNDDVVPQEVAISLTLTNEVATPCPEDCNGRGQCLAGKCLCRDGFTGADCSTSVCPVLCSGRGTYGGGRCHCETGWAGPECDVPFTEFDLPFITCSIPCGVHGKCVNGRCQCEPGYTGASCETYSFSCQLDCGPNGRCVNNSCQCNNGWTGSRCHLVSTSCDSRCSQHGQCVNGTCLCSKGWNGKHCTLDGCPSNCGNNRGACVQNKDGRFRCECSPGWTGVDCSIMLETECNDDKDNDGDGLTDCADSDCCSYPSCTDHLMCLASADPSEIANRKPTVYSGASFYQRVKFLVEDNAVQSYAHKDEYVDKRVAVLRGRVVSQQGLGIVGVRVSVERHPRLGFTLTRHGGWFDILVNGGGAVTLQFQRNPYKPEMRTVLASWNRIVVLDKIVLRLSDDASMSSVVRDWTENGRSNNYRTANNQSCAIDQLEMVQPVVIHMETFRQDSSSADKSSLLAEKQVLQEVVPLFGLSDYSLIYRSDNALQYHSLVHLQLTDSQVPSNLGYLHLRVIVEGNVIETALEAEANLTYTFSWDRHNVYRQKVYGKTEAIIHVGYEAYGCSQSVVWRTVVAPIAAFSPNISAVGEFNINQHHHLIVPQNIWYQGDGKVVDFKEKTRTLNSIFGNGYPRSLICLECQTASPAPSAKILNPVAMAAAGDGSLYVGDFNLVRRVTPEGRVYTVLQLPSGQISYSYYLAVSPVDGSLYVSDCERKQILRVSSVSEEQLLNPSSSPVGGLEANFDIVVGSGEPCLPADPDMCGDGGSALEARLVFPKGVAVAVDRTLYFADGTAIRSVDSQGIIRTIIGQPASPAFGLQPAPCNSAQRPHQIQPLWPTQISLNPTDNSLYWIDNNIVLKLSAAQYVQVVAGVPQHCAALEKTANVSKLGSITNFAFGPKGELYLVEKPTINSTRLLGTNSYGKVDSLDCVSSHGSAKGALNTNCSIPTAVTSVAVTPDGVIYIADKQQLTVYSLDFHVPQQDSLSGEYSIDWPATQERFVFNRYGQHVTTKDLATDNIKITFSYTKNGFNGKLMAIIDSKGNKIDFVRDNQEQVTAIETSTNVKSHLTVTRSGQLTHINSSASAFTLFDYDPVTHLLVSRTESDGLTSIYRYDSHGRLVQAVLSDGERVSFQVNSEYRVEVLWEGDNAINDVSSSDSAVIYQTLKNGSFQLQWGKDGNSGNYLFYQNSPNQWSEYLHLPVIRDNQISYTAIESQWFRTKFNARSEERSVRVNGQKLLQIESDQTGSRTLYDGDRQLVLALNCDQHGHLKELRLPPGFFGIRYSYDGNGRLQTWVWGQRQEVYSYDTRGLLAEVRSRDGSSGSRTTTYGPYDLPIRITLPSGRAFTYVYDDSGRLKSIGLPSSNSRHSYSVQPSMGYHKFMYLPPGSSNTAHAYVEHYDSQGRKLFVMFPGETGRIVYRYNGSSLVEEVSGDRRVEYIDSTNGQMINVVERDFESRTEKVAINGAVFEEKTDYGAKTGFASYKFTYGYDELLRVSSIKGRIGGQVLTEQSFSYQSKTGAIEQFGQFKMSRLRPNETSFFDGTAIFTRVLTPYLDLAQSSLTLQNVEVFRMELSYDTKGRINQTRTYTRYVGLKSYVNVKNYTYDADGQLVAVEAPESWRFSYDPNGNLAKLTYRGNSIPTQHNTFDRLIKFGEGAYQYDDAGNVIQNAREERFQWSATGLLVRAQKKGIFDVRYFYDSQRRLIGRKDHLGNITQFFYANPKKPTQVTHIFSPRDIRLTTLTYDDAGHLMYVQILRHRFYVATDQRGTPSVVFSQQGELVRELVRSPYGHVVYDSNPYLYMPIDWCGGIADPATGQVHVNGDRIYDPLIGQWLNPEWSRATEVRYQPELMHLYRMPRNDPINLNLLELSHNSPYHHWLEKMGYEMPFATKTSTDYNIFDPILGPGGPYPAHQTATGKHVVKEALILTSNRLAEFNSKRKSLHEFTELSAKCWPPKQTTPLVRFSLVPSTIGRGILVSRSLDSRSIITSTSIADPVIRDVFTSVLNNSRWLNLTLPSHSQDTFHFYKRDVRKAAEDLATLRRLGPHVNLTMHESAETGGKEIKIITGTHGNFVLVYGPDQSAEVELLWKHAIKSGWRRAWHREQIIARRGGINTFQLSATEVEQLASDGHLSAYRPELQQQLWNYPLLADDPTTMKFIRKRGASGTVEPPR